MIFLSSWHSQKESKNAIIFQPNFAILFYKQLSYTGALEKAYKANNLWASENVCKAKNFRDKIWQVYRSFPYFNYWRQKGRPSLKGHFTRLRTWTYWKVALVCPEVSRVVLDGSMAGPTRTVKCCKKVDLYSSNLDHEKNCPALAQCVPFQQKKNTLMYPPFHHVVHWEQSILVYLTCADVLVPSEQPLLQHINLYCPEQKTPWIESRSRANEF